MGCYSSPRADPTSFPSSSPSKDAIYSSSGPHLYSKPISSLFSILPLRCPPLTLGARTKIRTGRVEDIYHHHPQLSQQKSSECPPPPPPRPNSCEKFPNFPISQINAKFPESSIWERKQRVKEGNIRKGRCGTKQ